MLGKKIDLKRVRPERSEKRYLPSTGTKITSTRIQLYPEFKAALKKEADSMNPKVSLSLLLNLILEERYSKKK